MIWLGLFIIVIVIMFGFVIFRGSPYIPSHKYDIHQALNKLYVINSTDTLVDIGSGDGVILRQVAKRGAYAVGFEINPILVIISRCLSWGNKKIKIVFADFWTDNF
jgi:16S rRNA A1518/A1519 N6-dimethyltransferase RsmA/KsgA/DIM1 with predicted DNA glycosylase/AP lyase activity